MSQLNYDEVLKGPVEYAISLILRNNVYQFQLRDKRNNESPVLAFSNEIRFGDADECAVTGCPALTEFCSKKETASMIFDTNWHALCNQDACKSLPRFSISPPVRSIDDRKVNSKCTLKPFYMQTNEPPKNIWSDCYVTGGEMKKEADGAWTFFHRGNYNQSCSTEVKRNETNHWSVGKSENISPSIIEIATSIVPGYDINDIRVWFVKNYLQEISQKKVNSLGNNPYYPIAAICEEDLNSTKECNILKYNVFDENNIRRDIFLRRTASGEYSCQNVRGLRSSYESRFVLKKNSESQMLWELHEFRKLPKDPNANRPILRSINIEAGENPRNIQNQFNMCDRKGPFNELTCFGNDQNMDDVDVINAAHLTAPKCADDLDTVLEMLKSDFWSCDGLVLTQKKEPKISNEVIYIGNQEFRKNGKKFEMKVDSALFYTIEFEDEVWQFKNKTAEQTKIIGKSVSQNIFGQWVGICDDWNSSTSECGTDQYFRINSPAVEKKNCSLILEYQERISFKFNATTNSYQGSMGVEYEVFHSTEDLAWTILQDGEIKFKTPDFAAPCPDDIDYLLMYNDGTNSKNERLWIPDSRPFPSDSPEAYDHLEYPWEHYRDDIISYCHSTCNEISVAVSLNRTREVLMFNENEWIGGDYVLNSTHVDSTSYTTFQLYKVSSGNVIASSEHRFTRCPSEIHSWNFHCDNDDLDCDRGVREIGTAAKEVSATSDECYDYRPICLDVLETPYSYHPNIPPSCPSSLYLIFIPILALILLILIGWFCWKQVLIFRSKRKIGRAIEFYIRANRPAFEREEIDLSKVEVKRLVKRLFVNLEQSKLGEEIGKGQYGEVFKYKTGKSKINVIKKPKCCPSKRIMECDAGRHVVEEMLLMDKFENNSIMKINFISLDTKNNHIILGLELMENGSLLKYITDSNEIRTKQAIEWAYNIAEGLHYLHSTHQVIHRDIACRNILISKSLQVKVSDFGLAKKLSGDVFDNDRGYERDQTEIDVHRLAPELYLPNDDLRAKFSIHSDIWAYGLLIWETFSRGLQPFQQIQSIGRDTTDLEQRRRDKRWYLENNKPDLIGHSVIRKYPKLIDLLNQCLEIEPEERGSSYADFISKLQMIGSDIGRDDRDSGKKESWNKNEILPLNKEEAYKKIPTDNVPDDPYMPLLNNVAINPDYEGDLEANEILPNANTVTSGTSDGYYAGELESDAPTSTNNSPERINGDEVIELQRLIPNTQRAHENIYVGETIDNESNDNQSGLRNRITNCNIQ